MAATESKMVSLGTIAPYFKIFNPVSGTYQSIENLKSDIATVITFICNHCPYVIHINPKLSEIAIKYSKLGISFIAINSNDVVKYPEDSPEKMIEISEKYNYTFPYLYDETQEVAKAYNAVCTPDIFVYDSYMKLVYRGQFDNSRPNNGIPVTGNSLINVLDSILDGSEIPDEQVPGIGCNIKWK